MTMSTPPNKNGHIGQNETLITAVRHALDRYDPIRILRDKIQIDANDGTVVLSGIVRSRTAKEIAEKMVRQVKGVNGVENRLIADAEVELSVAQALGADARTQSAFPGILVGVVFGLVYLKGQVPTPEIKKAAAEIAAKVPGVRSISNELTILSEAKATA